MGRIKSGFVSAVDPLNDLDCLSFAVGSVLRGFGTEVEAVPVFEASSVPVTTVFELPACGC